MKKHLFIYLLFSLSLYIYGQTPVGSWTDHLVYSTAKNVCAGSDEVYASTGSSLMIFNKELSELKKMSRINGLSETGISTIGWSEDYKTLVIAYSSTNVDLLKGSIIYNIPDINNKYIAGNKVINRIRINGKYAYLACSFGIVVIDLEKREINDTWKPGEGGETVNVMDIAFGNGKIFAATNAGIYSADLSNQGLAYYANWNLNTNLPSPKSRYTSVIYSGNKLYVNLSDENAGGDQVYVIDNTISLFSSKTGVFYNSFDASTSGFTITSSASVNYYNTSGTLIRTITSTGLGTPFFAQAVLDGNDIWIADVNNGLIQGKNMTDFSALTLPGPISNFAYFLTSSNGKTAISGGGADVSWNNLNRPLQISLFNDNTWTPIFSNAIHDPMRILIDPDDTSHMFVSSWGGGLLEYRNSGMINHFYDANSPLQTIIAGSPFVRISGMALDASRNLWITQSGVPGSIKVLKPDNSWITFPVTIDAPTIGDMIITSKGQKWIILPRGYGLFVLDDNGTPSTFTDDKSIKLTVQDADGAIVSNIYSIAEDLDGNIWIGTDQGPLYYTDTERVFEGNLKANRIKIPRNDGTNLADYLLKTETINSIAIDGANRKWFGTAGSGAYLVSADGITQLKNFNESNSPVFSNSIISLSVDNKTGDVWFGTSKGVLSYRGNTTEGNEKFSKVYAFPNPVRETFTGNVTITGLIRDSQIRITDISGNLVYETISDGGEATWNLKTYNGKRVSTGVYLVFCSSKDGTQACVTKMLVIR